MLTDGAPACSDELRYREVNFLARDLVDVPPRPIVVPARRADSVQIVRGRPYELPAKLDITATRGHPNRLHPSLPDAIAGALQPPRARQAADHIVNVYWPFATNEVDNEVPLPRAIDAHVKVVVGPLLRQLDTAVLHDPRQVLGVVCVAELRYGALITFALHWLDILVECLVLFFAGRGERGAQPLELGLSVSNPI